ncbi:helix-turn-helix transcriptional regulator [Rhizobium leguminosarum bv. trifolii]|nr:helix-turn-helix transcriptional regulator [Rhizobium leguminosarum bv. trifolii]TAZ19530.1 XRE family transcriptional regulator [Rhizobium ruizarguesonis]
MSQTELGKKSGVSFQRIHKHEIGSNRVSPSRLQKIADALGVTPATLFGQDTSANDGVLGGVKDLEAFIASAEGKELNEAFQRIGDARIRKSVVTFVKSLAGAC